jgi:hypothetical protein
VFDWHTLEAGYLLSQTASTFSSVFLPLQTSPSLLFQHTVAAGVLVFVGYIAYLLWNMRRVVNQKTVFLELTPPSISEETAFTTQQLFSIIHALGKRRSLRERVFALKPLFSFEIVSKAGQGIRYVIRTTSDNATNLKRSLVSYAPYIKVKEVSDYIPNNPESSQHVNVAEFKLSHSYIFPLRKQTSTKDHDPVGFLVGMMTQVTDKEVIAFQVVVSPTQVKETQTLERLMLQNGDLLGYLSAANFPISRGIFAKALNTVFKAVHAVLGELCSLIFLLRHGDTSPLPASAASPAAATRRYTTFEQEIAQTIKGKIREPLFEASIRLLVVGDSKQEVVKRAKGFTSSLALFSVPTYQSLNPKYTIPYLSKKLGLFSFEKRILSPLCNTSPMYLSVSEVADLIHFPYTRVTHTEDLVSSKSRELPAPLTLKSNRALDVVFGTNTYGGKKTLIGLTEEERKTHMYIIGRTGCGKTTLMFSMAKSDIESNQGLAFIDPHGDVSEDLLSCIPVKRQNDLIYFNPFDLSFPVGINVLELTPGLSEDEAELEKEVVAEGLVSLFRKVFSKDGNSNAHRIEYILRNTIYTAFTVPDRTLFTIYDLLNNPSYRNQVIKTLRDENLKNFWKNEFGRAGDYQVVKMAGGVTAKIGRFLFSPTAKRILEQKKSTINFDEVLNDKILLCNLSQGKLGEDTTRLLGTVILTKIQQAALRRAIVSQDCRNQFHLYVDEFQNFATNSFTKMLSEGRKYGLDVVMAEQSASQQDDRSIVNILLANVTTLVVFRSGNPIDEQLMLSQLAPYVKKTEIGNLSRYHFYIKTSAVESEQPFSGETICKPVTKDPAAVEALVAASRKNWAVPYEHKQESTVQKVTAKKTEKVAPKPNKVLVRSGLPEMRAM